MAPAAALNGHFELRHFPKAFQVGADSPFGSFPVNHQAQTVGADRAIGNVGHDALEVAVPDEWYVRSQRRFQCLSRREVPHNVDVRAGGKLSGSRREPRILQALCSTTQKCEAIASNQFLLTGLRVHRPPDFANCLEVARGKGELRTYEPQEMYVDSEERAPVWHDEDSILRVLAQPAALADIAEGALAFGVPPTSNVVEMLVCMGRGRH